MRLFTALGLATLLALPVAAHADDAACEKSGAIVQQAVDARLAGESKDATLAMLTAALDADAGAQLAEYIYALPQDMLDDKVGAQFEQQCKAM